MGLLIILLLLALLIAALVKPDKLLGFINTSNAARRVIAVVIFIALVAGLFAYAFWRVDRSIELEQKEVDSRPLVQYADSMMRVYPNFANNDAVSKVISEDFEKRLGDLPGIIKDEPFYIVGGVTKIVNKYHLMLANESKGHLTIWCEDLDEQTAAKLDKKKYYKVVGGKIDRYESAHGMMKYSIDLGDIYVSGIQLEEVPGMEYNGI